MNKFVILLLLFCIVQITSGQKPAEPCCTIHSVDKKTGMVTVRNKTTGELKSFKANAADLQKINMNEDVIATLSTDNIRIGKIDKLFPVIVPAYGTPCCTISGIEPDRGEPCCSIVSFTNVSGQVSQFRVPKENLNHISIGGPVYQEPTNGMVLISFFSNELQRTSSSASSASKKWFAYPILADSVLLKPNQTSQNGWEVTGPATNTVTGRITATIPGNTRSDIAIFHDNKLLLATQNYPVVITPGNYKISINNIPIENVSVEKGKTTKLKLGFLVFSNDEWSIYDDSGNTLYLDSGPGKYAVPIGNYTIKLGDMKVKQSVKQNETTEF